MPANNTAGMTAAMKSYKTQVAKKKGQYASSDRMTAMAKAAGKPVAKKTARNMPMSPLKKATAKSAPTMGKVPVKPKAAPVMATSPLKRMKPKSYRASSR